MRDLIARLKFTLRWMGEAGVGPAWAASGAFMAAMKRGGFKVLT